MKTQTKTALAIFTILICILSMNYVSALTLKSVAVSPGTIEPGKSFNIDVRIENNEDTDLNDVSVSLNLQNLPFSSDSFEVSYDEIPEDKSKTAGFELSAFESAKSGEYQIPIQISYPNPDNPEKIKTISASANIKVSSEPEVDIDLGDNYLIEGQEGKINVNVINKGIADIKFLEVILDSVSKANLISSNRVYIGDLDSNDFDTVEFSITPKPGVTGSTNADFKITLVYKDIFNKEYTKSFDEPVKIYSRAEATSLGLITKSNTLTYIIVIIVVVVIYIVYRRIKKRRKLKKTEETY